MLVEREECCPEDHKQRNHLSLLPLSCLLAERDGLESVWITSGFLWDFCPLCVLSKCTYADTFTLLIHTHTYTTGGDWRLAVSAK